MKPLSSSAGQRSKELGTKPIGKLLVEQAVPASIGVLVMSAYSLVDTIFVGRWVGPLGIAAVTVVMPITFLIASIGMAIGIGGSSIISRALGAGKMHKASRTFGNMILLAVTLSIALAIAGFFFTGEILTAFGGKGDIFPFALTYFKILLPAIPFLAWAMMSNNVIRAEGKPMWAMFTMIIPAVLNVGLDALFIVVFDMGLAGAAWATTIGYTVSALYTLYYFLFSGKTEMRIVVGFWKFSRAIVKEIFSLGSITLLRQGTVSLLILVLNQTLFRLDGEDGVSVYGVINRVMMFAIFPVMGVVQGFMPIAGYNYGAKERKRVKEVIYKAILYGTIISTAGFLLIMIGAEAIVKVFTRDENLLAEAPRALRLVFLATPLIAAQLIGAAYFQSIGKAVPAILLTLTKQGFFLIPLVFILPTFLDINGVWLAFPVADVLATLVTLGFLISAIRRDLNNELA